MQELCAGMAGEGSSLPGGTFPVGPRVQVIGAVRADKAARSLEREADLAAQDQVSVELPDAYLFSGAMAHGLLPADLTTEVQLPILNQAGERGCRRSVCLAAPLFRREDVAKRIPREAACCIRKGRQE